MMKFIKNFFLVAMGLLGLQTVSARSAQDKQAQEAKEKIINSIVSEVKDNLKEGCTWNCSTVLCGPDK